jgi:hypothetical protein
VQPPASRPERETSLGLSGLTPGHLEELELHIVFGWLYDQAVDHRARHVDVVGTSIHLGNSLTEIDPAKLASKPYAFDSIAGEGTRRGPAG